VANDGFPIQFKTLITSPCFTLFEPELSGMAVRLITESKKVFLIESCVDRLRIIYVLKI